MNNQFNRSIQHLEGKIPAETIISSIQAVEELFTDNWLNQSNGHRLQILWARRDHLSTTELFFLGKAIVRLSVDNRKWLETTAKEIKKNPDNSHGLTTEIIMIGSLSTDGGVIKPYPSSTQVYDYEVSFDTGYKYKVSIKNFDITIHEKSFKEKCEIIRRTFKEFLKRTNSSGKLTIILEKDLLTKELLFDICCNITFRLNKHGHYQIDNGRYNIFFHPINEIAPNQLHHSSDIVLVTAKQNFNENRNIISKINTANNDLLTAPKENKSIKQLIIRLGATADFDTICRHIDKISEDWEHRGFDFIQVFQPQVVDDIENNNSSICTSLYMGNEMFYPSTSNMKEKLENTRLVRMEPPTGSISMGAIPVSFMSEGVKINADLSSYYSYQQGDIYIKLKNNNGCYEGELSRKYPGVLTHLVFENMTLPPIIYTKEERLLIV